jgi:hypothetical protein
LNSTATGNPRHSSSTRVPRSGRSTPCNSTRVPLIASLR